jgi:hypothetical protein
VELLLLVAVGIGSAILMFSILPLSVALLAFGVALVTFPAARTRFEPWQHIGAVILLWSISTIIFLVLIVTRGRESFEWLLDWS